MIIILLAANLCPIYILLIQMFEREIVPQFWCFGKIWSSANLTGAQKPLSGKAQSTCWTWCLRVTSSSVDCQQQGALHASANLSLPLLLRGQSQAGSQMPAFLPSRSPSGLTCAKLRRWMHFAFLTTASPHCTNSVQFISAMNLDENFMNLDWKSKCSEGSCFHIN